MRELSAPPDGRCQNLFYEAILKKFLWSRSKRIKETNITNDGIGNLALTISPIVGIESQPKLTHHAQFLPCINWKLHQ